MTPTDLSEPPGPILSSRARRHLLVLPVDPTDEDLSQVHYLVLALLLLLLLLLPRSSECRNPTTAPPPAIRIAPPDPLRERRN